METELSNFQLLTGGLYSGDEVALTINFAVTAYNYQRYLPWSVSIEGSLDGIITKKCGAAGLGDILAKENFVVPFMGKMPSGAPLAGKLVFRVKFVSLFPWEPLIYTQFAEVPLLIPNLDDVTPPGGNGPYPPPAVCTEGQEKCVGTTLMECKNSQWVVKEYYSTECGYVPVPPEPACTEGQTKCSDTTLLVCKNSQWTVKEVNSKACGYAPPDGGDGGVPGWFERNKTTIIVVSAVILAAALTILAVKKLKFRAPVVKK